MKTSKRIRLPAATECCRYASATPELPADLRLWVGEWGLVELALDAVPAEAAGRWGVGENDPEGFPVAMLLTLLTYCYAADLYASHDIELACHNDPRVRYICARQRPTRETIQRFRRAHHSLVFQSLARVMTEGYRRRMAETDFPLPPIGSPTLTGIQEFAAHKLQLAVLMDMAE